MTHKIDRRAFIKNGLMVLGSSLILPRYGLATQKTERSLRLYNIHNGEFFKGVYALNNKVIPEAQERLNYFLRDWRNNDFTDIDPGLLRLIDTLHQELDIGSACFDVISGYRSPATNKALRESGHGVAKQSYHCKGQAIDLKCAKHRFNDLYQCALAQKKGGVGSYARSGFVHVDVRGTPVTWKG